jgi:hypothetical protein
VEAYEVLYVAFVINDKNGGFHQSPFSQYKVTIVCWFRNFRETVKWSWHLIFIIYLE